MLFEYNLSTGHTILNTSNTALEYRKKLKFDGINVADDAVNGRTVVKGQLVKVTSVQYEALSSAEKNDPNTTYQITDAAGMESPTASITIATTGWSNSTTTVDGTAYYTHKTSLSSVFDSHPAVLLGALGTVPTDAEVAAFEAVRYFRVDTSTNKLICYAKTKPSANFVVIVKGVSI